MVEPEKEPTPEELWPSVDLAYEFVRPSYEWLMRRLEATETHIRSVLAFSASITLATPVFGRSLFPEVALTSGWLLAAVVLFALQAVIGVAALLRTRGLVLVDPKDLYNQWLVFSPWEFKKNAIFWAGEHFDSNTRAINQLGWVASFTTVLLVLELCCLVAWVARL